MYFEVRQSSTSATLQQPSYVERVCIQLQRVCAPVARALSKVSLSSRCRTALISFSPRIFFTNFSAELSKRNTSTRTRHTQSSLLDLPHCHSKSRENFHHDFYDIVGYCWHKRDPCINVESAEESLNGLEQVDKRIIACANILYHLINSTVTWTRAWGLRCETHREQNCKCRKYGLCRWEWLWYMYQG